MSYLSSEKVGGKIVYAISRSNAHAVHLDWKILPSRGKTSFKINVLFTFDEELGLACWWLAGEAAHGKSHGKSLHE